MHLKTRVYGVFRSSQHLHNTVPIEDLQHIWQAVVQHKPLMHMPCSRYTRWFGCHDRLQIMEPSNSLIFPIAKHLSFLAENQDLFRTTLGHVYLINLLPCS